jgi:hypothetical protein
MLKYSPFLSFLKYVLNKRINYWNEILALNSIQSSLSFCTHFLISAQFKSLSQFSPKLKVETKLEFN